MVLSNPDPSPNGWLQFITVLLPWATIFGLCWKALDLVFKYYSNAQDVRLRQMVQDEVSPDIKKLSTAIDELREAIWEMKKA